MRKIITLLSLFLVCSAGKAQYVNLPDSNFRNYLRGIYPVCFNVAGQMDTSCTTIINEDTLYLDYYLFQQTPPNFTGLKYFKNVSYLNIALFNVIDNPIYLPELPPMLKKLNCDRIHFASVPPVLPSSLQYINCSGSNFITGYNFSGGFTQLPPSLLYMDCSSCRIDSMPGLPSSLLYLNCSSSYLKKLPALPASLKYLNYSASGRDSAGGWYGLAEQPAVLPPSLTFLGCTNQILTQLPALPQSLDTLQCQLNAIRILPDLPTGLKYLDCSSNSYLTFLPDLPDSLVFLCCTGNQIQSMPNLPSTLNVLMCDYNRIPMLPALPNLLTTLRCSYNAISVIPSLPSTLAFLDCSSNTITNLPPLPNKMTYLNCSGNLLSSIPGLPDSLLSFSCSSNSISTLPDLPVNLRWVSCYNNNIQCIPKLPSVTMGDFEEFTLEIDSGKVKCLPNYPQRFSFNVFKPSSDRVWYSSPLPLCNPTNNVYHCESFPVMQGIVYYDNNNNNTKDANEVVKKNAEVRLSNGNYSFTNNNGFYELAADSVGNYSVSTTAPRYYRYAPPSYNYTFNSYDTLATGNFALQIDSIVDELTIRITPINWAARPGFSFPYLISYENTGTTTLSPNIVFDYDETRLDFNTSSVANVTDNTSMLAYNISSLAPGESGSFIGYFTLKTTVPLGDTLNAKATIYANTFTAYDSVQTNVRGAFDPNDKQATPQLSPSQVANGKYIDYTIRFQNTGTDTAFNIVISDTLNENLQANTLQMLVSSHSCKATVKDNIVFFEFLDILLPDSNVNEKASHGFVSFRIKPQTTVAANTTIPNSAAIYFDFNTPVITNTAGTLIKDFTVIPLKLVSFSAVPQNDYTTTLYWNTANEINTKHFAIERASDKLRFNTITTIAAKGKATNSYTASVADANTGILFYRLKIVDNDGSYTYSPIIKIDRKKNAAGFSILTNPVKDFIIINTTDKNLNNTQGSIINMQGATVKSFIIKEGSQTVEIKGLPNGIYYLRTVNGSSKVVIQ